MPEPADSTSPEAGEWSCLVCLDAGKIRWSTLPPGEKRSWVRDCPSCQERPKASAESRPDEQPAASKEAPA